MALQGNKVKQVGIWALFSIILWRTHLLLSLCLLLLLFISTVNIHGLTVILLLLYTYRYIYFSFFGVFGLLQRLVLGEFHGESQTQLSYPLQKALAQGKKRALHTHTQSIEIMKNPIIIMISIQIKKQPCFNVYFANLAIE